MQWFGGSGQHDGLWEIPIDMFLGRVNEVAKTGDRVLVVGASFDPTGLTVAGARDVALGAQP